MKLIKTAMSIFFFAVSAPLFADREPSYSFSKEKPLVYNFSIRGAIKYATGGFDANKFDVEAKGLLRFETQEARGETFSVKLVPFRTTIKVNEMLIEDFSGEESSVSQFISTSVIEISKNGRISSSREVTSGMLSMAQILRILPSFPGKLHPGRRWKQSIQSFSLPGMPMCNLEFYYLYAGESTNPFKVKLVANQPIKEKKKEGDVTISFTGKNSSTGEFLFDEEKGEIAGFAGNFGLVLNTVFSSPSTTGKEDSTGQSIPVKMDVDLDVKISRK